MEFIQGALSAAALILSLFMAYKLGQRSQKAHTGPQTSKADEQERQRAERLRRGFNELMSYDVTTALKGKKVT